MFRIRKRSDRFVDLGSIAPEIVKTWGLNHKYDLQEVYDRCDSWNRRVCATVFWAILVFFAWVVAMTILASNKNTPDALLGFLPVGCIVVALAPVCVAAARLTGFVTLAEDFGNALERFEKLGGIRQKLKNFDSARAQADFLLARMAIPVIMAELLIMFEEVPEWSSPAMPREKMVEAYQFFVGLGLVPAPADPNKPVLKTYFDRAVQHIPDILERMHGIAGGV